MKSPPRRKDKSDIPDRSDKDRSDKGDRTDEADTGQARDRGGSPKLPGAWGNESQTGEKQSPNGVPKASIGQDLLDGRPIPR